MRRTTLAVLVLCCITCHSVDTRKEEVVANGAVRDIAARDVEALLNTFHFPPGESTSQRVADKNGVRSSVDILLDDFGSARVKGRVREDPVSYQASAGAGTVRYWAEHPGYRRYNYAVDFEKRGAGWIYVDIVDFAGRPEVRWISFALPADRPGAKEAVDATFARLLAAVRPDQANAAPAQPQ